ncbi:MAG TPA: DUF4870 domain-containing protein [Puia sp.]|nr:DUF4870 domain-containing protein [Puia sp.]
MDTRQTSSFLGTEEQPSYMPDSDERTLSVLAHVLTLIGSFIPPLVIYLIKNKESGFVADHARESLNFQITLIILFIVSSILVALLIGIFLIWLLGIADLVLVIVAAVRASESKLYRYPFNIRLIR